MRSLSSVDYMLLRWCRGLDGCCGTLVHVQLAVRIATSLVYLILIHPPAPLFGVLHIALADIWALSCYSATDIHT